MNMHFDWPRWAACCALLTLLSLAGGCGGKEGLAHTFTFSVGPKRLNLAPGESAEIKMESSCTRDGDVNVSVAGYDPAQVRVSIPNAIDDVERAYKGFVCKGDGAATLRVTALPSAATGELELQIVGTHYERFREGVVLTGVGYVGVAIGPRRTLSAASSGGGRIVSSPAGIDCGATCSAILPDQTAVTLTALPDAGQALVAWTGCDSESGTTCRLSLNADRTVSARFAGQVRLGVTLTGQGQVTSSPGGIDCGTDCEETYLAGTSVALTASPASNFRFAAWGGDCVGTNTTITVDMNTAKSCVAAFADVGPGPVSGWQASGPALAGGSVAVRTVAVAVDGADPTAPITYSATTLAEAGRMDLIVQRYDGITLTLVGGGPINSDALPSGQVFTPALALVDRAPVVAWAENEQRVRVRRWTGTAWESLADNLSLDPAVSVFDAQLTTFGRQLVVAWLERDAARTSSRIVMKRYDALTRLWSGGLVLPGETNVSALRAGTDASGAALLMFVGYSVSSSSAEGPLRVVREGLGSTGTDVCGTGLTPPPPSSVILQPNTLLGFGVTRSAITGEPVAAFTNGEAVFVRACRSGAWVGLDGSALGRVTPDLVLGESMTTLSVAQAEGAGATLVWSKLGFMGSGDFAFSAQVLVENGTASAMIDSGSVLSFRNDVGLGRRSLSLAFAGAGAPVLGTLILDPSGNYVARTFRYVP